MFGWTSIGIIVVDSLPLPSVWHYGAIQRS